MSSTLTSIQLVRMLAQPDRRRVVAALILHDGPVEPAQIATLTGLPLRTVVDAIDRLVTAGVLCSAEGSYELVDKVFEQAARSEPVPAPTSAHDDQPADIARILDVAFKDGKLVQWPAKRTKRLVVLDHLAQCFEIGERYKEVDVNDALRQFSDDVATSRRYLVDEQFLDRGNGEYWRCGGSF